MSDKNKRQRDAYRKEHGIDLEAPIIDKRVSGRKGAKNSPWSKFILSPKRPR